MNKLTAIILTLISSFYFINTCLAEDPASINRANLQFGIDLYKKTSKADKNIFISPISLSAALSMTASGSRGQTNSQMLSSLQLNGITDTDKNFNRIFSNIEALNKAGGVELKIANSIWFEKTFEVVQSFSDNLKINYSSEIRSADFKNNSALEVDKINAWVSEKTNQKIKSIVSPEVVGADTRFVLLNAIYFYGSWLDVFSEKLSKESEFKLTNGNKVKTMFMNRKGSYSYALIDGVQIIALPYLNYTASMLIFLPEEGKNIKTLEEKLSADYINSALKNLTSADVTLSLPKFKMESSFKLKETLISLGMQDAFSPDKADFSGIDPKNNIYLSNAFHKSFIEIDEKGTEAAAATAVIAETRGLLIQREPISFTADRPFVFLILENRHNTPLFLGKLENPQDAN